MIRSDHLSTRSSFQLVVSLSLCSLLWLSGCGEPNAEFSFNRIYARHQENLNGKDFVFVPQQKQAVVDALAAMFGTPNDPYVANVDGLQDVLDVDRLRVAAGPVNSDEYGNGEGLYRQHCVHCHGVTGNGRGPTAQFLNPYPRDFTKGTFKFKSTPIGFKPTNEDLRRILNNGINGTAMPSFSLLSEGEIEALVDYVKYLSIRGEVERNLLELSPDFYDADDPATNDESLAEFHSPGFLVDEVLSGVVEGWNAAAEAATEVNARPKMYDPNSEEYSITELIASQTRGRELYYTTVANCFSCHGPGQLGDGQITDYDQWTKEFFDWTKKNDENYDSKLNEFLSMQGLPPRNILPRNLRKGIYRGGRRPLDLYWRIHNGIDGTPMPAANKAALQENDIWDLVNYVLSLPYEPASHPGVDLATNEQEIN